MVFCHFVLIVSIVNPILCRFRPVSNSGGPKAARDSSSRFRLRCTETRIQFIASRDRMRDGLRPVYLRASWGRRDNLRPPFPSGAFQARFLPLHKLLILLVYYKCYYSTVGNLSRISDSNGKHGHNSAVFFKAVFPIAHVQNHGPACH